MMIMDDPLSKIKQFAWSFINGLLYQFAGTCLLSVKPFPIQKKKKGQRNGSVFMRVLALQTCVLL